MACLEYLDWTYWAGTALFTVLWFIVHRLSMSWCPGHVTKDSARMEFANQIIAFLQEPAVYVPGMCFLITGGADWAYALVMFAFVQSSGYFVFDTYLKVRYGSGLVDWSMVPHHLLSIGFYVLWYNNSVELVRYSALLMLVELSSTALHTAYFAKLHDYESLYFISGISKLTLYPATRLLFIPWILSEMFANMILFEEECSLMAPFSIAALAFIFLISVYHAVVNFCLKMSQHLYLKKKDSSADVGITDLVPADHAQDQEGGRAADPIRSS